MDVSHSARSFGHKESGWISEPGQKLSADFIVVDM